MFAGPMARKIRLGVCGIQFVFVWHSVRTSVLFVLRLLTFVRGKNFKNEDRIGQQMIGARILTTKILGLFAVHKARIYDSMDT